MKILSLVLLAVSAGPLSVTKISQPTPAMVARMKSTEVTNLSQVLDSLALERVTSEGPSAYRTPETFVLANPYLQNSVDVRAWAAGVASNPEVCAVRFENAGRTRYVLRTFESEAAALAEGFIVTHTGHCGACSTLQDLAVYLEMPDLTGPARRCTKRLRLEAAKRCMRKIGFTEACAEAWAYNAAHTRRHCMKTCVKEYGMLNLILGRYGADNTEDGKLNPCIECDEVQSGPGFRYAAGRIRRNSGIFSSIERDPAEVSSVDHTLYFR